VTIGNSPSIGSSAPSENVLKTSCGSRGERVLLRTFAGGFCYCTCSSLPYVCQVRRIAIPNIEGPAARSFMSMAVCVMAKAPEQHIEKDKGTIHMSRLIPVERDQDNRPIRSIVGLTKKEINVLVHAARDMLLNDLTATIRTTTLTVINAVRNGSLLTEEVLTSFITSYAAKIGPLLVHKKVGNGKSQLVPFEIGPEGGSIWSPSTTATGTNREKSGLPMV
jgi:hypothetical protein